VAKPYRKPKRYTLSGAAVMAVAQPIWVCANMKCEVHHKAVFNKVTHHWDQPDKCLGCGGMAFTFFQSQGEANRWASLRLLEKVGKITKLRRQVRYGLFAIAPNGLQQHVADYIADYVYDRDGEEVIEDCKPSAGPDPVAKLKLKWMAAQRGKPVTIYKV
jgi:hypothetical protein